MKAVGLIVEYNPFHNGHYYHLHKSKIQSQAEIVVAVMSGYFLQRGEPALVSKWIRTNMALQAGADVVIELPYAFSTGKAEIFANGAISLLEALKADSVCFGSEEGSIDSFLSTIEFLHTNKDQFDANIKACLAEGNSFPKATSLAFQALHGSKQFLDLSKPNNILGYHYVKAIHDQNSTVKPMTIQRTGADYHEAAFGEGNIASATSIRKTLDNEPLDVIKEFIPGTTQKQLEKARSTNGMFHSWDRLFPYLQHKLLTSSPEDLSHIYEAEEGLENRLLHHIKSAASFDDFMRKIKTKRYTWTRLQRLCTHILTNTTKEDMAPVLNHPQANYIRLLGMSGKGQEYLNDIKKDLKLPLVSTLSRHDDPLLDLDKKAADCYSMGYPLEVRAEKLLEEYTTPPVRIGSER